MKQILGEHLRTSNFEGNWHQVWCEEVVRIFAPIKSHKGADAFTYGNAQKWVNMTLKNLYIVALVFQSINASASRDWCKVVITNANSFHIPIDTYILEAAFSEFETMQSRIKVRGRKEREYRILADGVEYCWSNFPDYQTYFAFQNALLDAVKAKYAQSPLDWENGAWIAVAQNRNQ